MNRRKPLTWLVITIIFIMAIPVFIKAYRKLTNVPSDQLDTARKQLSEVRLQHGEKYAPELFDLAVSYHDSAMSEWASENRRFPLFRDYSLSRYYADQASYWAVQSLHFSKQGMESLEALTSEKKTLVLQGLNDFKQKFSNWPLDEESRKQISHAWTLYIEANATTGQSRIHERLEKLQQAEALITYQMTRTRGDMTTYFQAYPAWSSKFASGVDQCKKSGTNLLIVDKWGRKCLLFKKGKLHRTYDIELGPKWIGDKQYAGDKTTPEGTYKIVGKKEGDETIYHKALLINYPNEEDKARFAKNKSKGLFSKDKTIGGAIEIHGHGGKGLDWTDGCMALPNEEMNHLFDQCSIGTPIIIVGSLQPLSEILK